MEPEVDGEKDLQKAKAPRGRRKKVASGGAVDEAKSATVKAVRGKALGTTRTVKRLKADKAEDCGAASEKKKGASRSRAKKAGRCPKEVVSEVQSVLLELMKLSESDSVRVAAAKALIDKIREDEDGGDADGEEKDADRAKLIAEARDLLDALAEALSRRLSGEASLVGEGSGGADNAPGQLADMADTGRARVGEDPNGGRGCGLVRSLEP